jgi:hypothetical protein
MTNTERRFPAKRPLYPGKNLRRILKQVGVATGGKAVVRPAHETRCSGQGRSIIDPGQRRARQPQKTTAQPVCRFQQWQVPKRDLHFDVAAGPNWRPNMSP